MKTRSLLLLLANGLLALGVPVRADPISKWVATGKEHIKGNSLTGFHYYRAHTMFRVAMFDAVNAAVGGYAPYALNVAAPGASPEAAVAQAAYTVLTNLGTAGSATLNTALAESLASVSDGPAKDAGIQIGRLAAETIIQLRGADNPGLAVEAPPGSTAVGRWRPTPPNYSAPAGTMGRYQTPWTLRSPSQFRTPPPPSVISATYTADYNEIRVLGSRGNTQRTPEQAASAQLQERGEDWTADVYRQHPLPLLESARREALLLMAIMDSQIQCFESKYRFNFWRPVTAIRNGAGDGNLETQGDVAWTPFLDTHPHPEYPSALVIHHAALAEILILLHGDNFSFVATSQEPATTRTFSKLSDYVEDGITARVVGGTHFRNTLKVSAELGRQIARHAFSNYLRPMPRLRAGPQRPGEFTLLLQADNPLRYVIETSTDLAHWLPWETHVFGVTSHTDTDAGPAGRRFYRTVILSP